MANERLIFNVKKKQKSCKYLSLNDTFNERKNYYTIIIIMYNPLKIREKTIIY